MAVTLVEKYNREWTKPFEEIKVFLREKVIAACIRIEHIGSTSIPGVMAKSPALRSRLKFEDANTRFITNFFHLRPDMPMSITLQTKEPLCPTEMKK